MGGGVMMLCKLRARHADQNDHQEMSCGWRRNDALQAAGSSSFRMHVLHLPARKPSKIEFSIGQPPIARQA